MGFETTNKIINERIQEISHKFKDNKITERERNELASLVYPKLKYYIWQYCKNNEDTEEALQWTFKKIFNNISKFDFKKGRFTTWIYTIARNETLFYLYQKRRSPIIHVENLFGSWEKADDDVLHEYEDNFQLLYEMTVSEINGIEDILLKNIAIDKMLKREKVKNIAAKYNINENTVKTKLRKIRSELKTRVLEKNPTFRETLNHIFDL